VVKFKANFIGHIIPAARYSLFYHSALNIFPVQFIYVFP
jgi:hypothetical protein